jgi:PIN domain nuclease of toxin-antitoxin system
VKLLLDTNAVIWMLGVSSRLKSSTVAILSDPKNQLWISTSTIHEIAVKVSIGKLRMPEGFLEALASKGCQFLPPSPEDAWRVSELPLIHRDPFDRLIVAQAMARGLTLMTSDRQLADYGVAVILI